MHDDAADLELAFRAELRRLDTTIEDLLSTERPAGERDYMMGVGLDVAKALPVLRSLHDGAGPAAVRAAMDQFLIRIAGCPVERQAR